MFNCVTELRAVFGIQPFSYLTQSIKKNHDIIFYR